jgi:hypothetical protein
MKSDNYAVHCVTTEKLTKPFYIGTEQLKKKQAFGINKMNNSIWASLWQKGTLEAYGPAR